MAFELENASEQGDTVFCASNLQPLLDAIGDLRLRLIEAFSDYSCESDPIVLHPALPLIFKSMTAAFREPDLAAIDEGMKRLATLPLTGALKEEVEQFTDAVLMMEYDGAIQIARKLTGCA